MQISTWNMPVIEDVKQKCRTVLMVFTCVPVNQEANTSCAKGNRI